MRSAFKGSLIAGLSIISLAFLGARVSAINGPVSPSQGPTRGPSTQVTPVPPPPRACQPGELIRDVQTQEKVFALTFDDGPWPVNTQAIMNILRSRGYESKATFFMVSNNLQYYSTIGKEVKNRGYLIGNHSKTHATYNPSSIAAEIAPAQTDFKNILGVSPYYFRSPGLTQGEVIQSTLAVLGMCNIFTDTDLRDYISPRISPAEIVSNFSRTLNPGTITLLHDGGSHSNTVAAIHGILDVAESRGYRLITLPELLAKRGGYRKAYTPAEKTYLNKALKADGKFNLEKERAKLKSTR